MLKFLLGFLKTPIANLVTSLQTNQAANIATIEASVGGGATTAEAAVAGFLTSEAKKDAVLGVIVPLVEPELVSVLSALVAKGNADVPTLYAEGITWLQKEETYL